MNSRWLIPSLLLAPLHPAAIAVAADYLGVDAAQRAIYPEADAFEELVVDAGTTHRQRVADLAGPQPSHGVTRFWRASQKGTLLGYFFVDEVIGRQSFITYALGIDVDGRMRRPEIMAYRESHGSEIRNTAWREQFVQRADLEHLHFRSDIKNISGATLSSEHVTQGVRWLVAYWQVLLRGSDGHA